MTMIYMCVCGAREPNKLSSLGYNMAFPVNYSFMRVSIGETTNKRAAKIPQNVQFCSKLGNLTIYIRIDEMFCKKIRLLVNWR